MVQACEDSLALTFLLHDGLASWMFVATLIFLGGVAFLLLVAGSDFTAGLGRQFGATFR